MKKLLFIIALFIGISAQAQITNSAGNVYVISEINSSQISLMVFENVTAYQAYLSAEMPTYNVEQISIYIAKEKLIAAENSITSLDGMTLLEKRNEVIYQLLVEDSKTNFQNWRRTKFETSDLVYKKI
jgi:hypothetical protein